MLQKCNMWKVGAIFFREPIKKHYLMEISKKSKLAHTSIKRYLLLLKKDSIIKESVEKKGNKRYPLYQANFDNIEYKFYKKIYNLCQLKNSGLISFLKKKLMPNVIVLFGSYAKGEDTDESDIDIFVECQQEKIILSKFEKYLGRYIQLHFKRKFQDYPKELRNNIINGIILNGYLEAFK